MIILYSGGLDSTVLLNQYKEYIKLAISFNYGSKHNNKEIFFAKTNCKLLNIEHKIIELPFINNLFKSNLLINGNEIPQGEYDINNIRKTNIPFRNGIMLSVAAGICESVDAKYILIANHNGDHAIYPDCKKKFIKYMNKAISKGTYANIKILAPYTNLNKKDIAFIGKNMNIDFTNTWSCYKGGEYHCGLCSTCVERKEALKNFDKTIYKV